MWFGRGGSGSLRMRCRWNCERACRLGQVESGRREREDGSGVRRLVVLMNLEFDRFGGSFGWRLVGCRESCCVARAFEFGIDLAVCGLGGV